MKKSITGKGMFHMKIQVHIYKEEEGIYRRIDVFIGAWLGILESIIEITTLGYISVDLRYQWAYRCCIKRMPE